MQKRLTVLRDLLLKLFDNLYKSITASKTGVNKTPLAYHLPRPPWILINRILITGKLVANEHGSRYCLPNLKLDGICLQAFI